MPDLPLSAKFLSYHSLKPLPFSQTNFGVSIRSAQLADCKRCEQENTEDVRLSCLPLIGLVCAEMKDEAWTKSFDKNFRVSTAWEVRICYCSQLSISVYFMKIPFCNQPLTYRQFKSLFLFYYPNIRSEI